MDLNPADDRLADDLAARDPVRRLAAIARIMGDGPARLSDGALQALIACLGSESKAVQRRAADALAATRGDARVVPAVTWALRSADARLRWGAAFALGAIGALTLDALPALLEALDSADGDVRWAAHELIVRLGRSCPEVRPALLDLAARGDPAARRMAFYCLRDLKAAGDDLFALIEAALGAADPHLRLAALSTLAHSAACTGRAAALATRCLERDADNGVRRAAAIALGHIGDRAPAVLDLLHRAAAHATDHSLARAARAALKRLEDL